MGRTKCCEKVGLKKGPWTPEEDKKLLAYIERHGHGCWRALPTKAGLKRCGKSCRLRWINYLRPDINRGKFSLLEEQTIIQLHAFLGNRWSAIATHLPKRTDNEVKNYWNTHLKKRLTKMGIDPITHKPKGNPLGPAHESKDTANLNHMVQWESARLEAEARLVRESKLVISNNPNYYHHLGSSTSSTQPLMITKPMVTHPCLDILKAWQMVWTNPNNALLNCSNNIVTVPSKEDHVQSNLHEIGDSLGLPSFMESFSSEDYHFDHDFEDFNINGLYDNLGSCSSSGNLEDNKKYWSNAIL